MKRISIFILTIIAVVLISSLATVGAVAVAEAEEITLESVTKVNSEGEVVAYDNLYSRDVTLSYSFASARYYVIRVYAKVNAEYTHIRTSATNTVSEGKGSYKVAEEGDLRIDCVAKDALGNELATHSSYVKSDITVPATPVIDADGVMEVSHSTAFSVSYSIGYDNLSGVDFSRSTYRFEDLSGNVIIKETAIYEGYDKALVGGINQNGKLVLTVYDNAGNFVVAEKSYTLHYYVDSSAPSITVTPSSGYSQNVMVSISWPQGVSYKYYRLVINGTELKRTAYSVPFSITDEGTVVVRAYYYEDGTETFVTRTIDNVDKTPPTSSSIAESVRVKIDLTSAEPVQLSMRVMDARSGVKRVYLKNFGTEFKLSDVNTYSLDVTPRLGSNVTIVAEDNAGNKTEYNYPLNGFDRTKIEYYSSTFLTLEESEYDGAGWSELLNAYQRLSNLMSSQDSTSGDIISYAQAVDKAIEGKYSVKVTLSDIIDGLNNDFVAEADIGSTSVKKGGRLNVSIAKIGYSEAELNEKLTVAATIAKFPAYKGYGFNISLTDGAGSAVTVYNQYRVSLTIPAVNKLAKVYYEEGGVLTQLSATIDNNVITFTAEGGGNFYLIVEQDAEEELGAGLTIGGKFYSLELLLITGGIILGAIILAGVLTPLIYKLVKKKKLSGKKYNYLK